MTATMKGGVDLSAFLAALPGNLERNVLRGALKAGADVIAEGAREECISDDVRPTIKTTSRTEPGIVTAHVITMGEGAYIAPWLENGTDPHFISVDDAQSDGKTVRRINREVREGSLVIGGKFVGKTVHHPGAKPHPFMRTALDTRETAAIEAIGAHIASKATKAGIETATSEPREDREE